jgi:hypothetical protein
MQLVYTEEHTSIYLIHIKGSGIDHRVFSNELNRASNLKFVSNSFHSDDWNTNLCYIRTNENTLPVNCHNATGQVPGSNSGTLLLEYCDALWRYQLKYHRYRGQAEPKLGSCEFQVPQTSCFANTTELIARQCEILTIRTQSKISALTVSAPREFGVSSCILTTELHVNILAFQSS